MTAAGHGQNMGIKLKNYRRLIQKQLIHSTAKHKLLSLNFNVELVIKFLSVVTHAKIMSCEYHDRFFLLLSEINLNCQKQQK